MEISAISEFTLGDLLDDESLGLKLLVGGQEARTRVVEGAHCIEISQPSRWLDSAWVMLTTGLALPEDPERQRDLIREIDESGAAALGFGIGISHRDVPDALVDEARLRNFPVFVVPLALPFRDVVSAVQHGAASSEAQAFGRLRAMQRYLVDALAEPDPEACIVARLRELVQADIAVVDRKGTLVCGAVALCDDRLRAAAAVAERHAQRLEEDGFAGWILPVVDEHGPHLDRRRCGSWLVAGAMAPRPQHPLLKAAAQLAVTLLRATARLAESRAQQDRALRRATLDVLMDARTEADAALAAARAHALGVEIAQGVRVAVVATRVAAGLSTDALLEAVENHEAAQGYAWLSTIRDEAIVVLVPADIVDEDLLEVLLEVHPHALVGIGRTVYGADAVSASRLDAALVVRQLSGRGPGRSASYDDLDLGSALIGEIDPDRIRGKIDRWLSPVLENSMAYETLVAYLEHDLDVGRTSRALNLHPNSARYRLARIEELLGAPLRRPSTIAALHFALLSQRYAVDPLPAAEAVPLRAA